MKFIKHIIFIFWLFFHQLLSSQNLSFTAMVSSNKVQVGENFQITFSLNNSGTNFKFPNLNKDFDVLSGPNPSNSISIINGNYSQTISYSFVIAAKKEGKYTIGPASVMVGNQKLETKPITIEVSKGANNNASGQNQGQVQENQSANISSDDLFIKSTLNKSKSYLGEQVTLVQKVYSKVNLIGFQDVKFPAYNGVWAQNEENNKQIELKIENLNGVSYYVAEISTTYLFPQHVGKITIDPTEVICIVRRQVKRAPRNIIEQFFGGGGYEDVSYKIKSRPVSIDVSEFPEQGKPENFNGAVGNYSYKTEVSKQQMKANESFNLKITISGSGNLKLTEAPKLNLPESFEVYDPKINEKINVSGGVSGTKIYDYLIIPRESGDFKLNELSFSYFDPAKKQYINIPSPEINIHVLPGDENSSAKIITPNKKEVGQKENDIRYIKTGDLNLKKNEDEFFSSLTHYLILMSGIILFSIGIYYRQQHLKAGSDIVSSRQRKAAKMARKQLISAEKHMKANQKELFFDEVLSALNRYVSYKLNIPVADLSKENIKQHLSNRSIQNETLSKLIETIDTCEYAKYAPGAVNGDLKTVYNNTVQLITDIEEELKA